MTLLTVTSGVRGPLPLRAALDQPVAVLRHVGGYRTAVEQQDAVLVEIGERLRRAEPLEIFRRREGVELHRKQLALDEIGLRRLAHADADVGLAHRQVEFLVGDEQVDADLGIELDEFAEPRDQPVHAEARRGGDAQVAVRPLAAVGQLGARGLELHEHFVRGAIEEFALLGEDQPARMAVEQRHREFLFERADLTRHGRLRQAKLLARMREAARLRCGVKNLQLVPVHR